MQMTSDEFMAWPNKAITLMGMSGVGKTTLAYKFPKSTWFHFSGDYRIGTKYLAEPILDNIKRQAMQVDFLRDLLRSDSIYINSNITVHNLEIIATFLGKIGRSDLGGLSVDEFKRRQRLHRAAEIGSMRDVADFIGKAHEIYGYHHFINDTGGSICELDDDKTIRILAEHTLILYIKADGAMEETLIQRAIDDPKPMYYQAQFLDENLAEYVEMAGLPSAKDIIPDDFARWVFPKLVETRRPKYQNLADTHGYTLDASLIAQANNATDFLKLVTSVLD
ncbi:MAG: ATPase [Gammaproteobacteria bacterium]